MAKTKKTKSAYADAWRRLKKNKVAMVSLVVICPADRHGPLC